MYRPRYSASVSATLLTSSVTTFLQGVEKPSQGDVMAAFSSRGPGGLFLKPDLTAPGVQILAGNTPTAILGKRGQLFQAIAGTSMAVSGAALFEEDAREEIEVPAFGTLEAVDLDRQGKSDMVLFYPNTKGQKSQLVVLLNRGPW